MVAFSDLLSFDGVCSVPVCQGSIVLWYRDGSCCRVSASLSSMAEVRSHVVAWSFSSPWVESVSFWCGSVLVARCSVSSLWAFVDFVLWC